MTMTPDPALQAWLDQEDRRTADIIRTSGTHIQYVGGDVAHHLTSFAYRWACSASPTESSSSSASTRGRPGLS